MTRIKKNSNNSYSIKTNLFKELEGTPTNRKSGLGWINWGKRNQFPDDIAELYYNSPTLKACVDFAVQSIIGEGVDYDKMKLNQSETVPNYEQTWDEFIRRIALDYILYNTFAFQIIKNNDGKTYSFYHQPIGSVRCSSRDEDGNITSYYICQDWNKTGQYNPIELKRFGFVEDQELKSKEPYLFVYEGYTPGIEYYPVPRFIGALKAAQAEKEMIRYDLRSITNGFSSNGFLTLPEVESEDEKRELLRNIKDSFTGSENAGSLVIMFSNGLESENLPKYEKIDKDASNSINLFESCNDRTVERIVSSFRIPSKSLIGYPSETASLGGDGNIMNIAYQLYNKTLGNVDRETIVNTLNKMFLLNGVETQVYLKPLSFDIVNDTIVTENREGNNPTDNDLTDDNIVEKITGIKE